MLARRLQRRPTIELTCWDTSGPRLSLCPTPFIQMATARDEKNMRSIELIVTKWHIKGRPRLSCINRQYVVKRYISNRSPVLNQKAVSAHFTSEQILPFGFAERCSSAALLTFQRSPRGCRFICAGQIFWRLSGLPWLLDNIQYIQRHALLL